MSRLLKFSPRWARCLCPAVLVLFAGAWVPLVATAARQTAPLGGAVERRKEGDAQIYPQVGLAPLPILGLENGRLQGCGGIWPLHSIGGAVTMNYPTVGIQNPHFAKETFAGAQADQMAEFSPESAQPHAARGGRPFNGRKALMPRASASQTGHLRPCGLP